MSSPYRTRRGLAPPQAPRDTGIVGDIIDQFADRYAFLRELVQNAIDADTESIDVQARYDSSKQLMNIAIIDRGVGMPREVIEERLLVLFRSTKEDDDTKIGKFGVGFASVLAVNPTLVRVTTAHAGARHTLHLFRDLSYELFETGRTDRTGTSVEVELELAADSVKEFVGSSLEALMRWCRHATVPIYFTGEAGPLDSVPRTPIVSPLALENALVEVSAESSDGMRAVVGIAADGEPYSGFFNHGLTLFETREPLAGHFAFKVQDGRLGHTLSRDNVRRDRRFNAAIAFVQRVVDSKLTDAASQALRDACEKEDVGLFHQLAEAVVAAKLSPQWVLPLVEEVSGSRVTTLERWIETGSRSSRHATPISAHLAELGVPVVDIDASSDLIGKAFGCNAHPISDLTLVERTDCTPHEQAILERALELLDDVHRAPISLFFADIEGWASGKVAMSCPHRAEDIAAPVIVEYEECERDPFAFFRRRSIAIQRDATLIERVVAVRDVDRAASLLTRVVLLETDALTIKRSHEIFEHDIELCGSLE